LCVFFGFLQVTVTPPPAWEDGGKEDIADPLFV
jgi:hypothetical protein